MPRRPAQLLTHAEVSMPPNRYTSTMGGFVAAVEQGVRDWLGEELAHP